jgi:hypothetical protein
MKNNHWRKEYIRIMEKGPTTYNGYETMLAGELIEAGYAKGKLETSSIGDQVCADWYGLTVKGRQYLDDLHRAVREQTLKHKLKVVAIYLAGVATPVLANTLANLYL